jgi:hypothetical protein
MRTACREVHNILPGEILPIPDGRLGRFVTWSFSECCEGWGCADEDYAVVRPIGVGDPVLVSTNLVYDAIQVPPRFRHRLCPDEFDALSEALYL